MNKPCNRCKKNYPRDIYHYYRNSSGLGDGFERVCRKCTLKRSKRIRG